MLIKRIGAAIVGVPILVLIFIYGGPMVVFGLFGVAMMIGHAEYNAMVLPKQSGMRKLLVLLGAALYVCWGLNTIYALPVWTLHLPLIAAVLLLFIVFTMAPGGIESSASRVAMAGFGLMYVPLMVTYLLGIYNLDAAEGWKYILTLFAIVWMNDTGAYFAGKSLGKHKLYPLVSPNKTWEGAVGGLLGGIVAGQLFLFALGIDWPFWQMLILSVGMGAIGQVGDLCESLIKRSTGIKDSGKLIPGHGGMLDRVDAVLFAAPFMYYYLTLVLELAPQLRG